MAANYVCYYRVSTKRQGESGLGLEAQQASCQRFVEGRGEILKEFTEVESGTKNKRPVLDKALEYAAASGAVLLVARLDRLSRNAYFLMKLKNSGVNFVCVDMPEMNPMVVAVMAVSAEMEANNIRDRTRRAMEAKKARGETWKRRSFTAEDRQKGWVASSTAKNEAAKPLREMCRAFYLQGYTYTRIQGVLTSMGLRSRWGKPISIPTISNYSRRETW